METSCLAYLDPIPQGHNAKDLEVECEEGKVWSFRLIIRKGRYKKPVLSAGWAKFAREKQLGRGFKVQFFKEEDGPNGEFKYKIKLKKPVILFNYVLAYVPYHAA
ncbi:hypothetical protein Pint_36190 [Pistacia integerrima]|uniref:Uncharacterized protein n=1 Tax=Pistacia integerrima TaxID=434235 RepID=A0ACC0Y512_9ROSI|nr:hypothetical protein Pint_36190 [Pistacia integerrima]